jgi:hypothetical protein
VGFNLKTIQRNVRLIMRRGKSTEMLNCFPQLVSCQFLSKSNTECIFHDLLNERVVSNKRMYQQCFPLQHC